MLKPQGEPHCPLPSRTGRYLDALLPTTAVGSGSGSAPAFVTQHPVLLPRAQDSSCSATPNEVLLKISTQVLIPDYSSIYTATPIGQFRMTYSAFPDGSLVAPPFISEVHRGDWTLLFSGMMLMLFIMTSLVAAGYIRRGRVKFKGLFYALLISQLCGVLSFIIAASTVIATEINCRKAFIAEAIFTELSSAILLSGILGVKAYRCLNDSKVVLATIIVLQVASSCMTLVHLTLLDASRRLSLSCIVTKTSIFFSLSTTLRFLIALFICFCFIYALWKSEKMTSAQGRVSIYLSDNIQAEAGETAKEGQGSVRPRGWWDHVPENSKSIPEGQETRDGASHTADNRGFIDNMRHLVGNWVKNKAGPRNGRRRDSAATLLSTRSQHQLRPSVVRFESPAANSRFSISSRAQSLAPSKTRSLGPLMNRMRLFREVMRNELAYTALITLFNVIATVLGLVGAFAHLPVDPNVFVGTYWGILSILVIHSFGRVVERHEREALLQSPSTWDTICRGEKPTIGEIHRTLTSSSVDSNSSYLVVDPITDAGVMEPREPQQDLNTTMPNAAENPFEDFEFGRSFSSTNEDADERDLGDRLAVGNVSPLTRAMSLLPEAPVLPPPRRKDSDDLFYDPRKDSRVQAPSQRDSGNPFNGQKTDSNLHDSASLSNYSDASSRPRSLFYLEDRQ